MFTAAMSTASQPDARPRGIHRAGCVMPATVEAVPLLRRFALDTAHRWGVGEQSGEGLAVIVTELVTNVVRHSGSLDVAVLLTTTGRSVTLHVQDTGRWRPRRPRLPGDDTEACCGRGLRLVRAYAVDCRIVRSARGTRVTATLAPGDETAPEAPGAY
ncbi:ATP-binding protein [Streptomyces sp. TRM64462]|uniref:ATP-binding protein n=1 Tax=Streptomyces sp. TRM64462 TaxID=2741726 RepID=UPI0020C7EEF2|nr:ATP-binding protein [Streptomyces sp. TRM64462]